MKRSLRSLKKNAVDRKINNAILSIQRETAHTKGDRGTSEFQAMSIST